MCLSIPYKIKKITGGKAVADSCQKKNRVIDLGILPNAKVGDWILALNNFAVQVIPDSQADELMKMLNINRKERR
ncbi:MAG: HypC/HybG/HupF family hydrogenase formation chaperone [Patescibacteria group bacterium]|nr:HypC/HybG/HupF family hydrogenase formation chaperone [Patescibacteria group bacterium]